jgi:hypothetical protein
MAILQSDTQIQPNPHQNCKGILHRNRLNNPKINIATEKTPTSQSNPD